MKESPRSKAIRAFAYVLIAVGLVPLALASIILIVAGVVRSSDFSLLTPYDLQDLMFAFPGFVLWATFLSLGGVALLIRRHCILARSVDDKR